MPNDSINREKFPFIVIIILAFLLVVIILFGPDVSRYLQYSNNPLPRDWDPISPIINSLSSFGNSISRMFSGFIR